MITIKIYKKAIFDALGEANVKNYRIENIVNGSNIMFEVITYDGSERTCVLNINLKKKSSKKIMNFINEEFIKEYSRLTDDGSLEKEYDHQENCYDINCDCSHESNLDSDDDDEIDSDCGFHFDDSDNWVPDDNDYSDDWSENLEPDCYYNVLEDGSIEFVNEYSTFKFAYKDEEEAKKYPQ